jgi:hypothetical protein
MSITDVIGWVSTVVLLATICRQVYSQWKSKVTAGLSRRLFIGQSMFQIARDGRKQSARANSRSRLPIGGVAIYRTPS